MKLTKFALLGVVTLVIALAGCSKSHSGDPLGSRLPSSENPLAPVNPADTIPKPPSPPQPPSIQPAVCVGFDSTEAGRTGVTHWMLGNDSAQPFTMHWAVTSDAGWPGFPITATVDLAPLSTRLIEVPIPVPAGVTPCTIYGLHMNVTRPGGLDYTAEGVIRVFAIPCPSEPPPAPVISPVEFFGSDSTRAGQTGLSHWRLGNNNDQPFTMHWSLACEAGWPGFPKEGSVVLAPRSTVSLDVPTLVPSGTATAYYSLEMTVADPAGGISTRQGGIRVWP